MLYVSDEPWEPTPKTKSTFYILYVRQCDNKLHIKKKIKIKNKPFVTLIKKKRQNGQNRNEKGDILRAPAG